jgi:hypothetical protein
LLSFADKAPLPSSLSPLPQQATTTTTLCLIATMKVSPRHNTASQLLLPRSSRRQVALGPWALVVVVVAGTSFGAGYAWCAATTTTTSTSNHWESGSLLVAAPATPLREERTTSLDRHTPRTTRKPEETNEGWTSLDVFYGTRAHISLPTPNNRTWYSQGRQDELVAGLLRNKRQGYFIDLAANDAVKWSNTFALEQQLDWSGLCIEPNAAYWKALSYRACQVVGAVVGKVRDEHVMFGFGNPQGGEFGGITSKPKEMGYSTRQSTVTLLEIFQRYNVPREIDYLSLDVEVG